MDIKKRYRYIDIIKGITIIWVVMMHLEINPRWPDAATQMGIFFFLSGMFYKPKGQLEFIRRKYKSLIVPLLWFWLISFIIMALKDGLFTRFINDFNGLIHNYTLSDFWNRYSYLRVNILWFLIALFVTNVFNNWLYTIIIYHKRWVMIIVSSILYIAGSYLTGMKGEEPFKTIYDNPWFPISPFMVYQLYFVIGYMAFNFLNKISLKVWVVSLIIYTLIFDYIPMPYLIRIVPYTVLLIGFSLKFFKKYEDVKAWDIFEFFGVNSIIIYLTHMLIIYSPWCQVVIKEINYGRFYIFAIVMISMLPLIYIFNKFIPAAVGKAK